MDGVALEPERTTERREPLQRRKLALDDDGRRKMRVTFEGRGQVCLAERKLEERRIEERQQVPELAQRRTEPEEEGLGRDDGADAERPHRLTDPGDELLLRWRGLDPRAAHPS